MPLRPRPRPLQIPSRPLDLDDLILVQLLLGTRSPQLNRLQPLAPNPARHLGSDKICVSEICGEQVGAHRTRPRRVAAARRAPLEVVLMLPRGSPCARLSGVRFLSACFKGSTSSIKTRKLLPPQNSRENLIACHPPQHTILTGQLALLSLVLFNRHYCRLEPANSLNSRTIGGLCSKQAVDGS